jgi:malate synthase
MNPASIEVQLPKTCPGIELLDPATLALTATLHEHFAVKLDDLLAAREQRFLHASADTLPDFDTGDGGGDWQIAEVPQDLRDRRVELYVNPDGDQPPPATAASVFVLDLDALLPVQGAVLGALKHWLPVAKQNAAAAGSPTVFVPRSIAAREPALRHGGVPLHAALLDLAVLLRHGRRDDGSLYLQLADIDSHEEAQFWADVFAYLQKSGDVDSGQLRVTVGIETLTAAFSARSVLHALRDSACALSGDRFRYLHNFAHYLRRYPQFLLPDRATLSTSGHFLHCWSLTTIQTAHRHAASAIGPCADYVTDGSRDGERLRTRLRADKERHAHDGFDGSGVADASLVVIAREVFDRMMPGQHQQHRLRADLHVSGADLLQVPKGKITEAGMRENLQVALAGLQAMAGGDSACRRPGTRETRQSVEFAALQLRQWVLHATGVLDDGRIIDRDLFAALLRAESTTGDAADQLSQYVLGATERGDLLTDTG